MTSGGQRSPWAKQGPLDVAVRSMRPQEADTLGRILYRSVHELASRAYSEEERRAWAPRPPSGPDWEERLAGQETVVAETDGRAVGFMALDLRTGVLDLAYVLPEVAGRGVADALYANLEQRARVAGHWPLTTAASTLAKPFFLRHGWTVVRRECVDRDGTMLERWQMEKGSTGRMIE